VIRLHSLSVCFNLKMQSSRILVPAKCIRSLTPGLYGCSLTPGLYGCSLTPGLYGCYATSRINFFNFPDKVSCFQEFQEIFVGFVVPANEGYLWQCCMNIILF